jgi:hypothetical protein
MIAIWLEVLMVWCMLDFDCSSLYFVVCAAGDIKRSISLRTRMHSNNFMFQNGFTFLHKTFSFENKLFHYAAFTQLNTVSGNGLYQRLFEYKKLNLFKRIWVEWFWKFSKEGLENLFKVASLKLPLRISDNSKNLCFYKTSTKNNQSVIAFYKGKKP